jgi:ParB-like chromosome segregation protein Spo0J
VLNKEYQFHPLANIFPLIDGQSYKDLMADVLKHGVREPVWLYEGQILDGRNRYRAAVAMGVDCPVQEYTGQDATAFVVSLNLHRRHLNEAQRGMVAAKLANLENGQKTSSANLQSTAVSQSDAADLLNVSTRTVAAASKIQDEAPPEVVHAVEAGEVSINLATQFQALPDEVKHEALESIAQQEPAKEVMREAVKKAHVAHNSGDNEWYTPAKHIELARAVMGGIDTDPASSEVANRTVKATKIFTAQDDGRAQEWTGRVWMNPPYAQPLIADFAEAVASKFESGEIEQACVLVNNGTETQWFQRLLSVASAVCFPKSRIKFLDPQGNPSGAPLQGQAIVYMGGRADVFGEHFSQEGSVLFA